MKVTDDLREWIEDRAVVVLHSSRALEKFRNLTYKHVEIAYGTEGYARDEEIAQKIRDLLEKHLPSEVLFWRVKPQLERSMAHAPEDESFATGKPYGVYVPPKTKIRLRLSLDGLRNGSTYL